MSVKIVNILVYSVLELAAHPCRVCVLESLFFVCKECSVTYGLLFFAFIHVHVSDCSFLDSDSEWYILGPRYGPAVDHRAVPSAPPQGDQHRGHEDTGGSPITTEVAGYCRHIMWPQGKLLVPCTYTILQELCVVTIGFIGVLKACDDHW